MKIILHPHETMQRRRAKERLRADAAEVHDAIRSNPGLPGKAAIAAKTGLPLQRVAEVIKRINSGETGHTRVEFGQVKPRGGPYAGRLVRGWFATNIKAHHVVLDQADAHGASIEVGVRYSRLVRYAQAQGIHGAEAAVQSIAERLGVSVEAMTQADLEAFEALLIEATEQEQEADA